MSLSYSTVAVFCGSEARREFTSDLELLGHALGRRNVEVVYGGVQSMMVEFARSVLCDGGHITAVVDSTFDKPFPLMNRRFSSVTVPDAETRKNKVLTESDMLIALPDEDGEGHALLLSDLQKLNKPGEAMKPVILLDAKGSFNALRHTLDEKTKQAVQWARSVDEAMDIFDHIQFQPRPIVA